MPCPRCGRPTVDEETICGQCGLAPDLEADPAAVAMVGRVLDERYRLQYLIGIGGMGAVYRAEVVGLGHTVAVKVLHPAYSADPTSRRRLENEANLASQIDHPNIVSILDMRSAPAMTYLVMEYLSGQSLADVLAAIGYLGVRRTVHITRQVLSALEAAERFDVLHRDLKPENVFLTASPDGLDSVKILDFGMATSSSEPRITHDGRICGTPAYMSPEQARGQALDPRSDLYAVGVMLYECLTAVNPFLGETATDTLLNQVTKTPPPPSQARAEAEIPPYLDALVLRSLRKSADDRFQSAEEFRRVLEGLVLARGAPTPQPGQERAIATCGECGRPVQPGADRCGACGQLLAQPPAEERLEDLLSPELIDALNESRDKQDSGLLDLDSTSTITACPIIPWDPPLVGMTEELTHLTVLFGAGRGFFLRILGGAGSGKGRLAREAERRAAREGWQVVWIEQETRPPLTVLAPLRRAAQQLLRLEHPPEDRGALVDAAARAGFPLSEEQGLFELFGWPPAQAASADERRGRRAAAWRALVHCAARRTSLLLVFRNLDQMDAPSQELVASLAALDPQPANPVGVVVTHDPGLLLLWPRTETWTLQPLTSDEALKLATDLLATARVDADPARVAAASCGVPLTLLELARLSAVDPLGNLPRSAAEIINRRLSWLPARPRTLLHAIAVLGRPAAPEILTELTGAPTDPGTMTLLTKHGFLGPHKDGWGPVHPMHRDVAYASTPAAVRTALHRKAAQLALREGAAPAHVAFHLFEAGDYANAVPHLLDGGWQALGALDDAAATKQFNRALQVIPQPPQSFAGETKAWVSATLGLARALADAGDRQGAQHLVRGAARLAADAGWATESALLVEARARLSS